MRKRPLSRAPSGRPSPGQGGEVTLDLDRGVRLARADLLAADDLRRGGAVGVRAVLRRVVAADGRRDDEVLVRARALVACDDPAGISLLDRLMIALVEVR